MHEKKYLNAKVKIFFLYMLKKADAQNGGGAMSSVTIIERNKTYSYKFISTDAKLICHCKYMM